MVFNATVLYPNEPDAKFDMDYYLSTHMPLVQKHWASLGLKSWEVVQFTGSLQDQPSQYSVAAILVFESEQAVKNAVTSESAQTVFGDVPNFSNKGPTFMMGNMVGSSGK